MRKSDEKEDLRTPEGRSPYGQDSAEAKATAYLVFLGTAAAVASKERDNTSLLLIGAEDKHLLIDCPGSIVQRLAKAKIALNKISNLLFTHSHPDHIYGLPSFLHSQYGKKHTIQIFAAKKVIKLIRSLVSLFELDKKTFPCLSYNYLSTKSRYPILSSKGLSAYSFPVRHLPDSLGFRFSLGKGKSLVFSGDTAKSPSLVKEAKNSAYLIHDCFSPSRFFKIYKELNTHHTSSLSLGEIAKKAKVDTLIPIHFCTELDFSMKELAGEIRKNFKGRLFFPEDLDRITI